MVHADIDRGRIVLTFPYSPFLVACAKEVPGGRWDAKRRVWQYPLQLKTARLMAETFGHRLKPTPALRAWSALATQEESALRRKATAPDAGLSNLSPDLVEYLKPYQRADVSFMASRSVINANQAGLGKTTEVVAATMELATTKPILVVSPVVSLESVWREAIERLNPGVPVFTGTTPKQRKGAMLEASTHEGQFWACINPELMKQSAMAWAAGVEWGAVVVDEFHTMGLSNAKSQFSAAMRDLRSDRWWPLSGSPLGGVPLNLWAALNWIDPESFPSQWVWASQWLDAKTSHFGTSFGAVKAEREREFYRYHAPWLIRRIKSEVAPELPPKTYRNVWVDMRPAQARQYATFERDAEIRLSGESMVATSKLNEHTRLKLFAFGSTKLEDGKHLPTPDSPKLEALVRKIDHHEGESQLVFSQSRRVAEVVYAHLLARGMACELLAGGEKDRAGMVQRLQNGTTQVLVLVTKAAGVSITLDRADVVHMLDQTWNPDDQEQAEDRAHRISRNHNVTVYYYRTRGTIEEAIHALNLEKQRVNVAILDKYRPKLLRT